MAYISQDDKKALAPQIKAVLKKYDMKGSIGINHYSSLVVNLAGGALGLIGDAQKHNDDHAAWRGQESHQIGDNYQVNTCYADEHAVDPTVATFFKELIAAMKGMSWYNNTDAQIDYFDIAYYLNVNVGKWNKPYVHYVV